MTVKNISIMEDVYKMLLMRKRDSESFSDVIRRTIGDKKNIMEFAGVWRDLGDEEIDEIKTNIKNIKEKSTKELSKRIKRLYS